MQYTEPNDQAKMSRVTLATALGILGVLLYTSIHISYAQNPNNSSGLTIDQLRFRLHTFQQLDKDNNAGNLTVHDLDNAHIVCNQLKQSGAPMIQFHICSSMPK
jgi:hypothetical protein